MKRTIATLALAVGFLAAPSASVFAEDFEITIIAGKLPLQYDIRAFTVKAGQTVKITLSNESVALQPHNLIVIKPGKLGAMMAIVNDPAKLSDPKWIANPLPESDDILHHTALLKVSEKETLEFTAPAEPGEYPYFCSYIGHAAIMNGVMTVTK